MFVWGSLKKKKDKILWISETSTVHLDVKPVAPGKEQLPYMQQLNEATLRFVVVYWK